MSEESSASSTATLAYASGVLAMESRSRPTTLKVEPDLTFFGFT